MHRWRCSTCVQRSVYSRATSNQCDDEDSPAQLTGNAAGACGSMDAVPVRSCAVASVREVNRHGRAEAAVHAVGVVHGSDQVGIGGFGRVGLARRSLGGIGLARKPRRRRASEQVATSRTVHVPATVGCGRRAKVTGAGRQQAVERLRRNESCQSQGLRNLREGACSRRRSPRSDSRASSQVIPSGPVGDIGQQARPW